MGFKEKIIFWLIPLVVLIILLSAYGGIFDRIKDTVSGIVSIGSEQISAEVLKIPEQHQQSVQNLVNAFNFVNNKENCFYRYGPLQNLGDDSLEIKVENGKTYLKFMSGAGGGQTTAIEELKLKPCVIAGLNEEGAAVAKNFEAIYFTEDDDSVNGKYFNLVEKLILKSEGISTIVSNWIAYNSEKGYLLNDNGWIFIMENQYICFFPTTLGVTDKYGSNEQNFVDLENKIKDFNECQI